MISRNMHLENPEFFNDMIELISSPNIKLIDAVLKCGCITFDKLHFDLMTILYELYRIPIAINIFRVVLNLHITNYLHSVICKNKGYFLLSCAPECSNMSNPFFKMSEYGFVCSIPVKVEKTNSIILKKNGSIIEDISRFNQSPEHELNEIGPNHSKNVQNSQLLFEIPAEKEWSETDDDMIPISGSPIEKKKICVVNDFQTFLSPLNEDYTKSSKGYICQNKSPQHETKLKISCNTVLDDDILNMTEDSFSNESSDSDSENYDPVHDGIISKYFDSLQSDSEISNKDMNDSDSDSSILFSDNFHEDIPENSTECRIDKSNKNIHMFISDSDSEENIEFQDYFNDLVNSTKTHVKTWGTRIEFSDSISSDTDSDTYENYSSPWSQSFEFGYEKNKQNFSSTISYSLSQSKMHISTTNGSCFVNPCFEEEAEVLVDSLRIVNEKWENTMQDVSGEPREPKRVSFVPLPDLVSVQTFEREEDCYQYGSYLLDQLRFKNRIEEFGNLIRPYLSLEYRSNVYQQYYSSNN